jgi:hypothetical protein
MGNSGSDRPLVLSYLTLRTIIGAIGIAIPFVLFFGKILVDGGGMLSSISAYYYTSMRDVFVGAMWAAGVFLISYRFDRLNDFAADIAGLAAIGIALFPVTPQFKNPSQQPTPHEMMIGTIHTVCAGAFFLTLALIAFFLFQRLDPGKGLTVQKKRRNIFYKVCGVIMFVCFVGMVTDLLFLQGVQWLRPLNPGFWLETLAILAFGAAWFVKGGSLLPAAMKK